tara:strand:- start:204114 stop:204590 length:477 start_codon:yes stop_codon:yes gene_type:complete
MKFNILCILCVISLNSFAGLKTMSLSDFSKIEDKSRAYSTAIIKFSPYVSLRYYEPEAKWAAANSTLDIGEYVSSINKTEKLENYTINLSYRWGDSRQTRNLVTCAELGSALACEEMTQQLLKAVLSKKCEFIFVQAPKNHRNFTEIFCVKPARSLFF